jgi:hypothetical protein
VTTFAAFFSSSEWVHNVVEKFASFKRAAFSFESTGLEKAASVVVCLAPAFDLKVFCRTTSIFEKPVQKDRFLGVLCNFQLPSVSSETLETTAMGRRRAHSNVTYGTLLQFSGRQHDLPTHHITYFEVHCHNFCRVGAKTKLQEGTGERSNMRNSTREDNTVQYR